MGKKRVMKIPKQVIIKCPLCYGKNKAIVSIENCPQAFVCQKCNQETKNPITQCCVICAYSNKKCPRTLFMDAKVKGLEIK